MTEHRLICNENGIRLDKFISVADVGLSRSAAVNLIENSGVTVNENQVDKKYRLSAGDVVILQIPDPVPYEAKAENIPLDIVYEDD